MAILKKREIEIPLNGGMDTSQGAEYQSVSTMRDVTDLRWNADGEYSKRPKTASTAVQAIPSGSPYSLGRMTTVATRGSEVFGITANHGVARLDVDGDALLYARRNIISSSAPDAALRYAPVSTTVKRRFLDRSQLSRDSQAVSSVASAIYNSETLVVAWVSWAYSGTTTLFIKAYDLATGNLKMEEQTVSLGSVTYLTQINAIELTETSKTGVLVSVAMLGSAPITIRAYRWDSATNDVVFDSNLTTNAGSIKHCLAASASNRFYFGFENDTTGFLNVQDRSTTTVTSTHAATHGAAGGCFVVKGPNRTLIASVDGASTFYGSDLYAEVFGTPADVITLRTVAGTAGDDWLSGCFIALETRSDTTDAAVVFAFGTDMTFAPVSVTVTSPRFTTYHYVDFAATTPVNQRSNYIPNAACIGAATVMGRAHGVFAMNPDRMQTTPQSLAVVRMSCPVYASSDRADVIARVCHERFSQYLLESTGDSDSVSVVGDTMHFVMQADPQNTKPQTLFHASVSMGSRPAPVVDLLDGTTLVGGGVLTAYDGQLPSEAQPLDKPTVYLDNTGTGVGELTGTFSVIAMYSWIDAAGKLHRSAPSEPVSIVLTSDRFDAYVSTPPFAAYDGNTAPRYNVELYVTEDGDSIYYRANATATDYDTWDAIDTKATFVRFTTVGEGSPDFPQVYTTGAGVQELPSTPPPAFSALWRVGDVVWGINAEDRSEIWHTKPLVAGYAPEWSNRNKLSIGDLGVGGSDVNGIPTIFGEHGIWQIYGEGPNANGVGSFAPARRLPHEVECLDALSVCKTPVGVVFRARKGITLLDNGLSLQPVGHSIDVPKSGTLTGYCKATYDEMSDEVHVLDFDLAHWVFNIGEGKWSKWSQDTDFQYWKDDCVMGGRVYFLHSGESGDSIDRCAAVDEFRHNQHINGWSVELPWVRFDGVTGNMRIWEIVLQIRVGDDPVDDTYGGTLSVTYRTREGAEEVTSWTGAQILTEAGGIDGRTINLRVRITNQRARQFKLLISEGPSAQPYIGHTLIGMRPIYGITPGGDKQRSTGQNKGTSVSS